MRRRLFIAISTIAVGLPACLGLAAESGQDGQLCVVTFNLRFASEKPPNAWPDRRPVTRECIEQIRPDLIGTQEGIYSQLKDVAADLPEFAWIGTGREGGSRGEFMAIFYRKDRLEPLEFDHFWLSDTPNVIGSTTWGNRIRRMVTWVRFLDRQSQQEFYCFNTHFDHENQVAREKSAALVRQRVEALNTSLPVLLIGDFNALAGKNKVYDILTEGGFFTDTWSSAHQRRNDGVATFHDYRGPREGGRIDWILARGPVLTEASEIVTCSGNGQYPSDHFPVAAWIRWKR